MLAFRCSRTGLYFPEDYVEEWGKKYGHGLGPDPVSECLVNDYHHPVNHKNSPPMHPVSVCKAQVDLVDVSEEEFNSHRAIIAKDDPQLVRLSKIMRDRQMLKSHELRSKYPGEIEEAERRIEANEY